MSSYAVLVPVSDYQTSNVGNDIGGIQTPETAAPLCTVRGYNTYVAGYAKDDLPYLACSQIPLSSNVSRQFVNDTRPSIANLYTNVATWSNTWNVAVRNNISTGYMLSLPNFQYDNVCYTNRGTYQAALLNTRYGLPLI